VTWTEATVLSLQEGDANTDSWALCSGAEYLGVSNQGNHDHEEGNFGSE
jgi:hypothetical protein